MFRHIFITILLITLVNVVVSTGNPVTNEAGCDCDQQLVFALVVNRHGDRAPSAEDLSLSDQKDLITNLTYLVGPEGLTEMGKQTAYLLGKFYRQRYGDQDKDQGLIQNLYFYDEIFIRSTDVDRTKMTIEVAMAATYPPEPEQQWNDGVGKVWQPVPYTTVPLSEDDLRFNTNCNRYSTLKDEANAAAIGEELRPYDDLGEMLMQKTGGNFTGVSYLYHTFYDLLQSTLSLGLEIPSWTKPILPRLVEAARLSYLTYFRNDEMKKIAGGVLLNSFIETADDIISGKDVSQRLRLFSAHNYNVGALMMASKVKSDFSIPDYGACFALELYKSCDGKYSVLANYLASPRTSSSQELPVIGCEHSPCDYNMFRNITQEYRLSESEYYSICDKV